MALANADWNALRAALAGALVLPGDDGYDESRVLILKQFDHIRPQAIAKCADANDVRQCVLFARRHGIRVHPRSGGHSFAGYSTGAGLVIDLSAMDAVEVVDGCVRAQAGAQLVDVYDKTLTENLAVPSGWCPTVAVGGLALGGGVGLETRKFGLTVDHVRSITVVLADGRVVRCDEERHADLFWALRGGGGGNFGIAVDFEFRPVPVGDVVDYKLTWPWRSAPDVIDAWQRWAPFAPDDLAAVVNIGVMGTEPFGDPEIAVAGVWHGEPLGLNPLLQRLVDAVRTEPAMSCVSLRQYREMLMDWFDCGGYSAAEAHVVGHNPAARIDRYAFSLARGGFFDRAVPAEGIAELLGRFGADAFPGQRRDLNFIAFGGACNRVAPDSTAFVHRDSLFYAGYSVDMDPVVTEDGTRVARRWIDSSWEVLRTWSSGHGYQNFMDAELAAWQDSYYGTNYPRLRQIKSVYDPDGFFDFPKAI